MRHLKKSHYTYTMCDACNYCSNSIQFNSIYIYLNFILYIYIYIFPVAKSISSKLVYLCAPSSFSKTKYIIRVTPMIIANIPYYHYHHHHHHAY